MEAFVRVIDAGSFSGAAKQLRLGQSAISKTIAQLEDRLGVRLLLRSTHGLTPTEAGRNFYERARRTIEEVEQAEAAARSDATTLQGRLRVSAPVTFTRLHIIPCLAIFLTQHPALDVEIILDDSDVNPVEAGVDIDCAWATLPIQLLPPARWDRAEHWSLVRALISRRTACRKLRMNSPRIRWSFMSTSAPVARSGPFAKGRRKSQSM
jgi:DNA-binding transcriptional LysR family regulator